jgi:hypothetical protein
MVAVISVIPWALAFRASDAEKKREKPEFQNVFDALGLQECEVGIILGFRSPEDSVIDFAKSNDGGARSWVNLADIGGIGFCCWRMSSRAAPVGNKRQKQDGENLHQRFRMELTKSSKA